MKTVILILSLIAILPKLHANKPEKFFCYKSLSGNLSVYGKTKDDFINLQASQDATSLSIGKYQFSDRESQKVLSDSLNNFLQGQDSFKVVKTELFERDLREFMLELAVLLGGEPLSFPKGSTTIELYQYFHRQLRSKLEALPEEARMDYQDSAIRNTPFYHLMAEAGFDKIKLLEHDYDTAGFTGNIPNFPIDAKPGKYFAPELNIELSK